MNGAGPVAALPRRAAGFVTRSADLREEAERVPLRPTARSARRRHPRGRAFADNPAFELAREGITIEPLVQDESFVPAAAVTAHEIVEGWVRDYALALPAEGVPPGVLQALVDRAAEAIRQAQEAERTRALGRAGT